MKRIPKEKKKVDSSVNGSCNLLDIKEREIGKVQLRIDRNTIILVDKKNKNEKYKEAYKNKINFSYLIK